MQKLFNIFMVLVIFGLAGCAASEGTNNAANTVANEASNSGIESSDQLAANTQPENDPDEMICRREVVTGTNFRREVCLTRAEREESGRQTQEFYEVQRNRPNQ